MMVKMKGKAFRKFFKLFKKSKKSSKNKTEKISKDKNFNEKPSSQETTTSSRESVDSGILSDLEETEQVIAEIFNDEDGIYIEEESDILSLTEMIILSSKLPHRLLCCEFNRAFSSRNDGFSLKSLYRSLKTHDSKPAILLIRDMNGNRFGAFVSSAFRVSPVSYGCGETFVFNFQPDLRVWKWTEKNNFFILCSTISLCVGIDDGKFAIFLDESLDRGRSQACETFGNDRLTATEDFNVADVEVWVFD